MEDTVKEAEAAEETKSAEEEKSADEETKTEADESQKESPAQEKEEETAFVRRPRRAEKRIGQLLGQLKDQSRVLEKYKHLEAYNELLKKDPELDKEVRELIENRVSGKKTPVPSESRLEALERRLNEREREDDINNQFAAYQAKTKLSDRDMETIEMLISHYELVNTDNTIDFKAAQKEFERLMGRQPGKKSADSSNPVLLGGGAVKKSESGKKLTPEEIRKKGIGMIPDF